MDELGCVGGRARGRKQMVMSAHLSIVWAGFHYGGKWAGCAGRYHGPASVQTCSATKSFTLGKSQFPEQLCPGTRWYSTPHNWAHRDVLENQDVEVMDWPLKGPDSPHNTSGTLQWCHNERHGVSNNQCFHCLLSCWYRPRSKKTSKLCVTGLCAWNSPLTGEFPAQKASNAENASIWWRYHDQMVVHIRDMDISPTTVAQLRMAVQQDWVAPKSIRLKTLVRSLPNRVCAVLAVRGEQTNSLPTLYDAIDSFYWLTKFEKCSMLALLLWTVFIDAF